MVMMFLSLYFFVNRPFAHFQLYLLNYVLQELFPFKASKRVPFHAKFNENDHICCPFHCSCYTGYHFSHRKGNESIKNGIKMYNFVIKSGICKKSIENPRWPPPHDKVQT